MKNVPNPEPSSMPGPLWVSRRALGKANSRRLDGSPKKKVTNRAGVGSRPRRQVDPQVWERGDMRRFLACRDLTSVYRILQRHGMSQRWIAARTGHAQSEVSEIVSGGRRVVSYDVLLRIAVGLELPRGWLGLDFDADTAARFKPELEGEL